MLMEFIADYFAQVREQDRLPVACTEEYYDAKGEKHVVAAKEAGV